MGARRKYLTIARASLQIVFAYRAGFLLNMVGTVFYVVAMFYLWQTIFAGNSAAMAGFTWSQMKAYILVAFVLNSLMSWYDEGWTGRDIREGQIATDLCRPMDIQASRFGMAIGPLPTELLTALLVGAAVILAFGGVEAPADPLHAALFVVSAGLATFIKFGLIWCVSMAAFWTTSLFGVVSARVAIQNIFSGALIPLAFFPDWLRLLSGILPFQAMVSTPALTYLGKFDGPTTALMLGIQAAWAVGLILLGRLLWSRAVRVVTIYGG